MLYGLYGILLDNNYLIVTSSNRTSMRDKSAEIANRIWIGIRSGCIKDTKENRKLLTIENVYRDARAIDIEDCDNEMVKVHVCGKNAYKDVIMIPRNNVEFF